LLDDRIEQIISVSRSGVRDAMTLLVQNMNSRYLRVLYIPERTRH